MPIKTISPAEAHRMINAGAALIDIRSPEEHARERVAGSLNVPLDRLEPSEIPHDVLIFHCRSGVRTGKAASRLTAAAGGRECYIVEGGLNAWGSAGLPIVRVKGAPIELQRQVMIVAGLLVLAGTLLSLFAVPALIWLAVLVGAGLIMAGISGFCGMARLLALMPWNRLPVNE